MGKGPSALPWWLYGWGGPDRTESRLDAMRTTGKQYGCGGSDRTESQLWWQIYYVKRHQLFLATLVAIFTMPNATNFSSQLCWQILLCP